MTVRTSEIFRKEKRIRHHSQIVHGRMPLYKYATVIVVVFISRCNMEKAANIDGSQTTDKILIHSYDLETTWFLLDL